jgi:putative ABC transport system ATP-binding protein
MIELTDITKSYQMGTQTVHALRGVSATINDGEFVAIMGPSGSGKSTLMNIIGCLDLPSEGTYRLDGIDVSDMSDDQQARVRNRRFNLLARAPALKQVMLPLMYMGLTGRERQQRAERALDMVGLGERMDHKPEELSGGQQQRVAIARALATQPSLILADEPTGALDTKTGEEIMTLFKDLHAQGITIVTVTHDPEIAEQAQRTIHIRDGVVVN